MESLPRNSELEQLFYTILHIFQPLMFIYEVFGLLNILSDANKCKQVLLVQPHFTEILSGFFP